MIKRLVNIALTLLISSIVFSQNANQQAVFSALNYLSHNQTDSALIVLEEQNNCIECKKIIAEIYFSEKNLLNAAHAYKELSEFYPSESYFRLSVIYAGLGFSQESVKYLEKHFEYPNPKSYSSIMFYNEFDEINTTTEWKEFWNEERYSKKEIQLEEAKYLISTEEYDNALKILEEINFSSQKAQVNYLMAYIYANFENWSEAYSYVNEAIVAEFDYVDALTLKRDIEIERGMNEEALLSNISLMNADPYNPYLIRKHAELLYQNEKPREADQYLDEYLEFFSDDEQANHLKTKILSADEDFKNALINLNLLIDQNPSKSEYFIERADIYYTLESWRFASNDYSMALDINPRLPEVWYHFGVCQFNMNNQKAACNAWERAANLKSKEAVKMLYKYCK